MRIFILLTFLTFSYLLHGTPCARLDAELALLSYSGSIPENLGASRTAVLISYESSPVGDDWKELARDIHGTLAQMAIDPVMYVNSFDYYASDMVRRRFEALLKQRQVRNLLIFVVKDAYAMELVLVPYAPFVAKKGNARAWKGSANSVGGLLFQLGTAVKQAELKVSNFLIATKPEFLEDITLFNGDRLPNYAGAMRRQKVGLAMMEEISIPAAVNDEQRSKIEAFNASVRETNTRLQEVFEEFEYDWQPIVYTTDEVAMGDRIQYIVFLINTSGEHIRKMLNYELEKNETDYLSVTPGMGEDDVSLKRLSAESLMYKVYVKQTRSNDLFVGREWDADDTPERALRNFLFTWNRQVLGTK